MKELLKTLESITGTGSFCSSGHLPFFFPQIRIESGNEIAFPLNSHQAKALIAQAEKAPYGQGEETIHDEAVRKSWQLDASQITIESPQWPKLLNSIVKQVKSDLGVEGKVHTDLYKFLIYGPGGHFKPHRDTEKLDAMFGTLIIHLPSQHTGGLLQIKHGGQTVDIDFSSKEHLHDFQYTAFFADCEHSVAPVQSGYRCCLVYNLVLRSGDTSKLNQETGVHTAKIVPFFKKPAFQQRAEPVAILLDHQYTEASFSLRSLKGHDPAKARSLMRAAEESDFNAYLALVTLHQEGELEGVDFHYSGRRSYWDDDDDDDYSDGTIGEIYDESLCIEHWIAPDGEDADLGCFRLNDNQILSQTKLTDGEPIEKFGEGPTGNAGCTMEYWYRHAAVVIWPKALDAIVRVSNNPASAARELEALANANKGGSSEFHKLATTLIDVLASEETNSYNLNSETQPTCLRAIAAVKHRELYDKFTKILGPDHYEYLSIADWTQLFKAFSAPQILPLIKQLDKAIPENLRDCTFNALEAALYKKDYHEAAANLLPMVLRFDAQPDYAYRPQGNRSQTEELHILIAASFLTDAPQFRNRVLELSKADKSLSHIREKLAPALLAKSRIASNVKADYSLFPELLGYAIEQLQAEVAKPIEPFPDWTRQSSDAIKKAYPMIHTFLVDSEQRVWIHSAIKETRQSIETFIKRENLDLDVRIIRKGSPHKIECTKNSASYERALKQRAVDKTQLKNLKRLRPD